MRSLIPALLIAVVSGPPGTMDPSSGTQRFNFSGQSFECQLDGGSPAQCDVGVTCGAHCVGTIEGSTAADSTSGLAIGPYDAGCTVTFTSTNGKTNKVSTWCDK